MARCLEVGAAEHCELFEAAATARRRRTFYTYFNSKEDVFREVARQVNESMMEAMHAEYAVEVTHAARTRMAMVRFIDAFQPNAIIIALLEQVSTFTPEMAQLRLTLRNTFVELLAFGIERLQAEGIADPDVNPALRGCA